MALGKIDTGRQHSDKDYAERSRREILKFIIEYKAVLNRTKSGIKTYSTAVSMNAQDFPFTPNQLSMIDGLYEKTLKAMGFKSVPTKHDIKRRVI